MMENGVHPNQFIMNALYDPPEQNVLNITIPQRDRIIKRIKNRMTQTDKKFFLYKVYEEMVSILEQPLLDTNKEVLYNTLKEFDTKRKLNSRKVFPELYED